VLDAARHLHAQGVKVTLKCPITRDNQEEVLDMYRLAEDVGVTIIFDPVITPRDDGDKDPLAHGERRVPGPLLDGRGVRRGAPGEGAAQALRRRG